MDTLQSWICVTDNWLTPEECDRFLQNYQAGHKGTLEMDWRKCEECRVVDLTLKQLLKDKLRKSLDGYRCATKAGTIAHVTQLEDPTIFKYSADKQHFFSSHSDNWSMQTASRQVSVIVYLNDVAEGGETEFDQLGVKIQPVRGRMLMFPSFYLFQHKGCAPISGDKYIIVCWCHFGGEGHAYRVSPF